MTVETKNPLDRLQAELDAAVRDERFEDAVRLRDLIRRQMEDPLSPGTP